MSNNRDESNAGIAVLIAGTAIMAFILLALLSFLMTLACLFALHRPLRIGKFSIEPHQARAFIGGGLFGAIGVPLFAAFCQLFMGIHIEWRYLPMLIVGGYTLGSLGVAMQYSDEDGDFAAPPSVATIEHEEPQALPGPKDPPPYRYASWDDEERRS